MISISAIISLGVLSYFLFLGFKMFTFLNPLHNVDLSQHKPSVFPLWVDSDSYSVYAFLSTSSKLQTFSISNMHKQRQFVLAEQGIILRNSTDDVVFNFVIQSQLQNNCHYDYHSVGKSKVFVASNDIWAQVNGNKSSVFLHTILLRTNKDNNIDDDEVSGQTIQSGNGLHGVVRLIKYSFIPQSFKHRYLLSDFGFVNASVEESQRLALSPTTIISYWKPEVAVRLMTDTSAYPADYAPRPLVQHIVRVSDGLPRGTLKYKPPFYVDEIGLTSDKYMPLNFSVCALPLQITIGELSLQRWLLLAHMNHALIAQANLGVSATDLDDVRRLIADTSIYFLAITMVAALLHLLFEFLAFESDITFWKNNESMVGLSGRSLIIESVSQVIIFLFLVESGSSLLVTVPSLIGVIIQFWKVSKAFHITIVRNSWLYTVSFNFGSSNEPTESHGLARNRELASLVKASAEADRTATINVGLLIAPAIVGLILKSLIVDRHTSWYSWILTSLSGCVYSLGFLLMCPQLFINHKLKSVSHLPWKFLVFKFITTFVDDLFAFIIKMPAMHRISVFRDDLVFIIYMYQRWQYRVDPSRPMEK